MDAYERLPYVFDLYYDVKDLAQVERIVKGMPDCSEASPEDLLALFIAQGMEVPKCLKHLQPLLSVICRCPKCSSVFNTRELLEHEKIGLEQFPVTCESCSEEFSIQAKFKLVGWAYNE